MGHSRKGKKSDVMNCLTTCGQTCHDTPMVTAVVIDGAALVHMLQPSTFSTFGHYCKDIFLPFLLHQYHQASRIDIIFDRYFDNSLEADAREKQGSGQRLAVKSSTPIPKGWNKYLAVDKNKAELFHLSLRLSHRLIFQEKISFARMRRT